MIPAYPLTWPDFLPRSTRRENGPFKTTLAGALKNVEGSLTRFGKDSGKPLKEIVLSSNCTLGRERPSDPGVAAWFMWDSEQVCIAVDRYNTPEANLQAIHHIIEARRVELRHGTLALVKATFRGFAALPAPPSWWQVLAVPERTTAAVIHDAYRRLAMAVHPDRPGGSVEKMKALNAARDEGLRSIRVT